MNRRLMVLNVALAGAIVYGGVELRGQWLAAKARQAQIQRGQEKPAPAPPFTGLPEVAPVMASAYANVAQKFLLDPSRDPNLPVEVQPPPPPPPPMPALPFFHGMMNIGNGPEIILSLKTDAVHKRVQAGETIGEFTLVAFNSEQIELEWNGQRIIRSLAELSGHAAAPQAAAEASAPAEAAAVNVRPEVVQGDKGPGLANDAGQRACQEGDTAPAGTERDGVVKTVGRNPITHSDYCIWLPKH